MRQIFFMIQKEFRQVFRSREMIGIIFGIPLVQMVILGFTITNEVKYVSLLIADYDNSQISHEIIQAFANTDRFTIIGHETNPEKIESTIQEWDAQIVLNIPLHFAADLRTNLFPELQIIVDGLDGNSAGIALSYAQGILMQYARESGTNPVRIRDSGSVHLIENKERMWYNLNLDNAQYMIPGIVVTLMTIISTMLSAMSLVKEKEIGTLEQLMVTPLKRYQLLFGKIIPFLILTFIELMVVMTCAKFIFNIQIQGSYLLLALLAFLFLFTTLGFGIFISTLTNTQQEAMFMSWFFMVFMLLMSGFFIPIENMPDFLQSITYLNPMRYFLAIIRDIFQKGSTISYLLIDVIPMTIYGVLIFLLGVLNFHKRLA
jgi:ABC-2 type transport system permease protein